MSVAHRHAQQAAAHWPHPQALLAAVAVTFLLVSAFSLDSSPAHPSPLRLLPVAAQSAPSTQPTQLVTCANGPAAHSGWMAGGTAGTGVCLFNDPGAGVQWVDLQPSSGDVTGRWSAGTLTISPNSSPFTLAFWMFAGPDLYNAAPGVVLSGSITQSFSLLWSTRTTPDAFCVSSYRSSSSYDYAPIGGTPGPYRWMHVGMVMGVGNTPLIFYV